MIAAMATGLLIGMVIGGLVAIVRIPSFVVTLAFFLGLQGIALKLIGEGGTVPVHDNMIFALSNDNMPVWLGWTLAVVVVVVYAAFELLRLRRQAANSSRTRCPWSWPVSWPSRSSSSGRPLC